MNSAAVDKLMMKSLYDRVFCPVCGKLSGIIGRSEISYEYGMQRVAVSAACTECAATFKVKAQQMREASDAPAD